LVLQALTQIRVEYETVGRGLIFKKLSPYLGFKGHQAPYAAVGQELGMSEDAVKMAVCRLRRRFRAVLRSRISETVSNQEDVTEELRYLCHVLTRRRD
jgi:hypothetical protein